MTEYVNFLKYIKLFTPKFQSDYCRYNAKLVAEAASRGHISCIDWNHQATSKWKLTHLGYDVLKAAEEVFGG